MLMWVLKEPHRVLKSFPSFLVSEFKGNRRTEIQTSALHVGDITTDLAFRLFIIWKEPQRGVLFVTSVESEARYSVRPKLYVNNQLL